MTWPEVLSIIAAMGASGSLGVAYMAYRLAKLQALPHPDIGMGVSRRSRVPERITRPDERFDSPQVGQGVSLSPLPAEEEMMVGSQGYRR